METLLFFGFCLKHPAVPLDRLLTHWKPGGANSGLQLICGRVGGSLGYSSPCIRKNPKLSHL